MQRILTTTALGQLILDTRKKQNITQQQLAAGCGVGIRFIRELEHGKESCHLQKSLRVLQMLGLEVHVGDGVNR